MVVKYYEARCDGCGRTLDYFEQVRPVPEDIKRIGNVVDAFGRFFCNDECKRNYYKRMK